MTDIKELFKMLGLPEELGEHMQNVERDADVDTERFKLEIAEVHVKLDRIISLLEEK